jgi:hypothetical protein
LDPNNIGVGSCCGVKACFGVSGMWKSQIEKNICFLIRHKSKSWPLHEILTASSIIGDGSCIGYKACYKAKDGKHPQVICTIVDLDNAVSLKAACLKKKTARIGDGSCTGDSIKGVDYFGFSCGYLQGERKSKVAKFVDAFLLFRSQCHFILFHQELSATTAVSNMEHATNTVSCLKYMHAIWRSVLAFSYWSQTPWNWYYMIGDDYKSFNIGNDSCRGQASCMYTGKLLAGAWLVTASLSQSNSFLLQRQGNYTIGNKSCNEYYACYQIYGKQR